MSNPDERLKRVLGFDLEAQLDRRRDAWCLELERYLQMFNTEPGGQSIRNDRASVLLAREIFIRQVYEPLTVIAPGWVLPLLVKVKGKWSWAPAAGISEEESHKLEQLGCTPEEGQSPSPVEWWKNQQSLDLIVSSNDPNSLDGVLLIERALFHEIGCGLAVIPTLSPYLFVPGVYDESAWETSRRVVDCLSRILTCQAEKLASSVTEKIEHIKEVVGSNQALPGDEDIELGRATKPMAPSRESLDHPESVDFTRQPYFDVLEQRFTRIAERLLHLSAREIGSREEIAFRVSFLVKDKRSTGFKWFLTRWQAENLRRRLSSPEGRWAFYEQVFHTEVYYGAADSADESQEGTSTIEVPDLRRYTEGMVGFAVSRGNAPVLFSTPSVPKERRRTKERFRIVCDALNIMDKDRLSRALRRSRQVEECEALLWPQLPTVEVEIANSAREAAEDWTGLQSYLKSQSIQGVDAIVCVLQFEDWRTLLQHLAHEIQVAREEGRRALIEMAAMRAQAEASKVETVSILTHAYKNLIMPLHDQMKRLNPQVEDSIAELFSSAVSRIPDTLSDRETWSMQIGLIKDLNMEIGSELACARIIAKRLYSKIFGLHLLTKGGLDEKKHSAMCNLVEHLFEAFCISWLTFWTEPSYWELRRNRTTGNKPFQINLSISHSGQPSRSSSNNFGIRLQKELELEGEKNSLTGNGICFIDKFDDCKKLADDFRQSAEVLTLPVIVDFIFEEIALNALKYSVDGRAEVQLNVAEGSFSLDVSNRSLACAQKNQATKSSAGVSRGGLAGIEQLLRNFHRSAFDYTRSDDLEVWTTRVQFLILKAEEDRSHE